MRRGCWAAIAWLVLCLSIVCVIYGCAALSGLLTTVSPQASVTPRLQADYSPWLPTTFGPVLDTLLLEAARDLNLAGSEAGVPAEICLLPEGRCTPEPPSPAEAAQDGLGAAPGAGRGCPASGATKCKPSAAAAHP